MTDRSRCVPIYVNRYRTPFFRCSETSEAGLRQATGIFSNSKKLDITQYAVLVTTRATHRGGLVVDGSVRDLNGISEIDMPAYFRAVDPTPIGNVMLTGINVPVRIGGVTVMPGDLVVGDREGVYFIPPQFVQEVLDRADETHIHDEWTKRKFDEGKYKSSQIYGSPIDPKLQEEYQAYLKRRLEDLRKQRTSK